MAVLCASRSDIAEEARAAPLHVPAALLRKKGAELNSWPLQFAPLPLSNSCRPAKSSLFYCQISFLDFSPPAPVALSVYDFFFACALADPNLEWCRAARGHHSPSNSQPKVVAR